MNNIRISVLLIMGLLTMPLASFSKGKTSKMMRSDIKTIQVKIQGESKLHEWTISPELNPDVFSIYDVSVKSKKIKFVSDIDSIEFNVKVNNPIYFSITYNGDTAKTIIDFNNTLPNKLSKADKLMALSVFWSETKYNFAFYDQLTFSWDSLYKAYIPQIEATTNDVDFYDLIDKFAGSLQDGHSGVYSRTSNYKDYIPFAAKYFGDTLKLIRVRENLESIYPLGSKILEINGIPVDEYMDKYINPFVNSKVQPTQRLFAASKLFSSRRFNDPLTVKYITPNGDIRIGTPPIDGEKNRTKSVGHTPKYPEFAISIDWKDNNIAVLSINTFNERNEGDLIGLFENIKDTLYSADGLIIDLRYNGGGKTDLAWYFIKHIIKDTAFLGYAWQTRINDGVRKANGNWIEEYSDFYNMCAYRTEAGEPVVIEDSIRRFNMPIVILISSATCSAAEDFIVVLYERQDRPTLIGQPSFGSTGSPLILWDWPDKNSFAKVCTRRVLFPYSMKPFDKGIDPDILVEYTFEEYMSGVDKDIEVAVDEILKQIRERIN